MDKTCTKGFPILQMTEGKNPDILIIVWTQNVPINNVTNNLASFGVIKGQRLNRYGKNRGTT